MGEFSGADAIYAPIVLRFSGYDVKPSGFAGEYIEMVLQNAHMQSWVEAGKKEAQIITFDEA
jgi:glutathione S-transferase